MRPRWLGSLPLPPPRTVGTEPGRLPWLRARRSWLLRRQWRLRCRSIATEMAAVEATAPPEVAALAAPSRMEFEQAVRGMESVVAGLQDQLEAMRTLVADLDRSSHEEATRYEIPLVKVDGGPYFPGERCDSPWVKHTPITFEAEWRGPSDTGWLCESTTSTEGEPTERWCMTTGWEQGFFMCSGNVDRWLRGWNRNE